MSSNNQLTKDQIEAIREMCRIAAGNAATALTQILKTPIKLNTPTTSLVTIKKVGEVFGNPEMLVYGVYFGIYGEMQGSLLVTYPHETAMSFVKTLISRDKEHVTTLTEIGQSALKEVGNVVAGSFVNAMAKFTGKFLWVSVPHLAYDMVGAIVDFIQIELAQVVEDALVIEIEFFDESKTLKGQFLLLPNPGSLEMILKAAE